MPRFMTLGNKDKFFEKSLVDEVFTASEALSFDDVIVAGICGGWIVSYCDPCTPAYKAFGSHTYRVSRRLAESQMREIEKKILKNILT